MRRSSIPVLFLVALGGCASLTPRQVVEPSGVTLQAAVKDVRESIDYLQKVRPEDRVGLLLDEVTVTFNVAASANAKNSGKLSLASSTIPPTVVTTTTTGVSASAEASTELTNDASRGNQIVMKFKNLATADYSKGSYVTPGTVDYSRRKVGRPLRGGAGKEKGDGSRPDPQEGRLPPPPDRGLLSQPLTPDEAKKLGFGPDIFTLPSIPLTSEQEEKLRKLRALDSERAN